MATDDKNKSIRPLGDNPAGRIVMDPVGNRWEWNPDPDETARRLQALNNNELRIERSSIVRKPRGLSRRRNETDVALDLAHRKALEQTGGRDAGGGFNPYDHSGEPRRR